MSDRLLKNCEILQQKYDSLFRKYSCDYNELLEYVKPDSYRPEYAKSDLSCHRGYYCPSRILDIVIGGCNRGKKVKQKPKNGYYYEYVFNKKDELIASKVFHDTELLSQEVVLWNGQTSLSIEYGKSPITAAYELCTISECCYDHYGRIIEYELTHFLNGCWSEVQTEKYEYHSNQFICFREEYDIYNFNKTNKRNNGSKHMCSTSIKRFDTNEFVNALYSVQNDPYTYINQRKYIFNYDNNGYIASFLVESYKDDEVVQSIWDGHIFDVSKKRAAPAGGIF